MTPKNLMLPYVLVTKLEAIMKEQWPIWQRSQTTWSREELAFSTSYLVLIEPV